MWRYCPHSVFSPWWYICWFMHQGNRVLQYCNIPVMVGVIFISVIAYVITLLRRTCPNHHKPPISHQLRRCSKLRIAADISNIDPLSYVFMKKSWHENVGVEYIVCRKRVNTVRRIILSWLAFFISLYRIMIEDVCLHVFNLNYLTLDLFWVSQTHSWYTSLKPI